MKKLLMMVTILTIAVFGAASTYAAASTSKLSGPEAFAGYSTYTSNYKLTSPTYSSVRGDRTHIAFYDIGYLRSGVCVMDNNRTILVQVREDDAAPNEDEVVLKYNGKFSGLKLTELNYSSTPTPGNIDSAGDPTVELYVHQTISATSGDYTSVTNGPLFNFILSVD